MKKKVSVKKVLTKKKYRLILKNKEVSIPRDFRVIVSKNDYDDGLQVLLYKKTTKIIDVLLNHKYIANIDLAICYSYDNSFETHCETHSYLEPKYRRTGLGTILYAYAINFCLQNKLKISSSTEPSSKAERVWRSKKLNRLFNIKENLNKEYEDPQFTVIGYKRAKIRLVNSKKSRKLVKR